MRCYNKTIPRMYFVVICTAILTDVSTFFTFGSDQVSIPLVFVTKNKYFTKENIIVTNIDCLSKINICVTNSECFPKDNTRVTKIKWVFFLKLTYMSLTLSV